MWTWMLAPLALGAVPTSVRPVVAPDDAPAQHEAWEKARGHTPEPLACEVVWKDHARVCFTVVDGEKKRWVTEADLASWGVDLDAVVTAVIDRARAPLSDRPRARKVDEMAGTYWLSAEGDGWDAALLREPQWIVERVGAAPVLVAAPADGTILAWRPGDAELDKVMAVGARRMFDTQPGSVTPMVFQWDGKSWLAFGQAVAAEPKPPAP
jgi:hypothetical protein